MDNEIKLNMEVKTYERFLVADMLGKDTIEMSDTVDIADGVKVEYTYHTICKSVGIPETVNFVITISPLIGAVGLNLLSNYLYDKLKGKTEQVSINRQIIEIDNKNEIMRIINEKITQNN